MIPEPTTIPCTAHTTDDDWPRPIAIVVSPDPDTRNHVELRIGHIDISVPAADLIAAINKARGHQ